MALAHPFPGVFPNTAQIFEVKRDNENVEDKRVGDG
jgi:hypothetical protein